MKRLYFLTSILLLLACDDKRKMILTDGNYKYWDIISLSDSLYTTHYSQPALCYVFKSNGECRYYTYSFTATDTTRELFDFDDVIVTNKWEFKSDSVINILGWDYLYNFTGKDTIVLTFSKNRSDRIVIVGSKLQFDN